MGSSNEAHQQDLERERKRAAARARAAMKTAHVSMVQFENALQRISAAVNRLALADPATAKSMKSRLGQIQSSYRRAADDAKIRAKLVKSLKALERRAQKRTAF